MLSKTTLLALSLAATRFTIAAPSHNEVREMKICSQSGTHSNCAEDEHCLYAGADDAPDDVSPMVFKCIKKSDLTKPWPRGGPEGCSANADCDEGLECRPDDTEGFTTAVLKCLPIEEPDMQNCSADADCEEGQQCRADETGGITIQVLKCQDKPPTGQCRTEDDCDGGGCAFTLQYPRPEFGFCVGGNSNGNSDNEKRTRVVPCTGDFGCVDVNDVCVTRTFFSHEGPLNLCVGTENAGDGDWCQDDEGCEGEKTCASRTGASKPMSGTCVLQK